MRRAFHVALAAVAMGVGSLLMGGVCDPTPVVHEAAFGGLTLRYWQISKERVGRTEVETTFAVQLRNDSGLAVPLVEAHAALDPGSPHAVVVGDLTFAEPPGGTPLRSPEDLVVRVDRSQPFAPSAIEWSFDAPGLEIAPSLDPSRTVSGVLGSAGGALVLQLSDIQSITLDLPPGALAAPTTITMTAITDVPDTDLVANFLAGVQLAPDGLELQVPATLLIDPVDWNTVNGGVVTAAGDGSRLQVVPSMHLGTELSATLEHFSSASGMGDVCPPGDATCGGGNWSRCFAHADCALLGLVPVVTATCANARCRQGRCKLEKYSPPPDFEGELNWCEVHLSGEAYNACERLECWNNAVCERISSCRGENDKCKSDCQDPNGCIGSIDKLIPYVEEPFPCYTRYDCQQNIDCCTLVDGVNQGTCTPYHVQYCSGDIGQRCFWSSVNVPGCICTTTIPVNPPQ